MCHHMILIRTVGERAGQGKAVMVAECGSPRVTKQLDWVRIPVICIHPSRVLATASPGSSVPCAKTQPFTTLYTYIAHRLKDLWP